MEGDRSAKVTSLVVLMVEVVSGGSVGGETGSTLA